jgi:hypothetical protein
MDCLVIIVQLDVIVKVKFEFISVIIFSGLLPMRIYFRL